MNHSVLVRGCMTALAVAIVLTLLRRSGPRAGGLAAALPMTSLPALAWASADNGPAFAAAAALAALLATAMTGLFAMLYAHAAQRRWAPTAALIGATLPGALLTVGVVQVNCSFWLALCGSVVVMLGCRALLPAASVAAIRPQATRRHDLLQTVTVAGLATTLIGLVAACVPPLVCGLVATIPVIGMSTAIAVHRQDGAPAVVHFLHGYVQGLWSKLGFLAVLAWSLPQHAQAAAWLAALTCGVAVLTLQGQRIHPCGSVSLRFATSASQ